ncbi:MAG: PASTA domain-containing protein [Bacteroidales bacterium]|nr:MAG: PASTA domain-containing protein [Bacteroidales bacterium]
MWENIKKLLLKIYSNYNVQTILFPLIAIIGSGLLFFIFLFIFTRHGQSYPVPSFNGLKHSEVIKLANKYKLRVEITDSVYILTRKPGTVVEQNPPVGTNVKQNRRVLLTINARSPKKVEMPNIVGVTLRQAKAILDLQGLIIGNLIFVPDIAVNNVLEQKFKGKTVEPGKLIAKGSRVDLILGRGMQNERTGLPLLIGLNQSESRSRLIDASLNLGQVKYDETIKDYKDSLDAMVYSQYPGYSEFNSSISFGARVDIWLTLNEARVPRIKAEIRADSSYMKIDSTLLNEIVE